MSEDASEVHVAELGGFRMFAAKGPNGWRASAHQIEANPRGWTSRDPLLPHLDSEEGAKHEALRFVAAQLQKPVEELKPVWKRSGL
jgi:hypothetical protein